MKAVMRRTPLSRRITRFRPEKVMSHNQLKNEQSWSEFRCCHVKLKIMSWLDVYYNIQIVKSRKLQNDLINQELWKKPKWPVPWIFNHVWSKETLFKNENDSSSFFARLTCRTVSRFSSAGSGFFGKINRWRHLPTGQRFSFVSAKVKTFRFIAKFMFELTCINLQFELLDWIPTTDYCYSLF